MSPPIIPPISQHVALGLFDHKDKLAHSSVKLCFVHGNLPLIYPDKVPFLLDEVRFVTPSNCMLRCSLSANRTWTCWGGQ